MSFADQLSICRTQRDLALAPTEQEWRLARLERPGMYGDRHIKQVLHPGKYRFNSLAIPSWTPVDWDIPDAAERRAGRIRTPRRVRLENVSWRQLEGLDWTLHLPMQSPVVSVPTDIADDAGLGYYNCRLIGEHDVITLYHRSLIVDFCYQVEYFDRYVVDVLGGCSIEHHDFAHVDMPRNERSGHLLIGRIDPIDHAVELTAFVVKPMQRVYIPAQTIHTNDYLLGTWETLLSSDCEFPSAQLKPLESVVDNPVFEHALPRLSFCD